MTVTSPILNCDAIRRLCRSLILDEQQRLLRDGRIGRDCIATLVDPMLSAAELDRIPIVEDTLGFDSLSIQDLILRLDSFFELGRTGIEDYFHVRRTIGEWIDLLTHHLGLIGENPIIRFKTSGSTGSPKTVAHPLAGLVCEVEALLETEAFGSSGPSRIVSMVPAHHIYGFIFTCLLPSVTDVEVLECSAAPVSSVRLAQKGDLVVGTPWHWSLISRSGKVFENEVSGLSSGGQSDEATWSVLENCKLSHLLEIYGSTETAGVGWRCRAEAPFRLLKHLNRDAAGTVRSFLDERPLQLQDHLHWYGDRAFQVIGRIDDVVQVAGANVSPKWLRDQMLNVDGILDAVVRLDGDRLKAFVVPDPSLQLRDDLLADKIRARLRAKVPSTAVPQSVCFGPQLPRNAMGKLCDWTVPNADDPEQSSVNSN